jgi:hypothetical protein
VPFASFERFLQRCRRLAADRRSSIPANERRLRGDWLGASNRWPFSGTSNKMRHG